jgi:hypothetical protein
MPIGRIAEQQQMNMLSVRFVILDFGTVSIRSQHLQHITVGEPIPAMKSMTTKSKFP